MQTTMKLRHVIIVLSFTYHGMILHFVFLKFELLVWLCNCEVTKVDESMSAPFPNPDITLKGKRKYINLIPVNEM